jgi:hypothetical protein
MMFCVITCYTKVQRNEEPAYDLCRLMGCSEKLVKTMEKELRFVCRIEGGIDAEC